MPDDKTEAANSSSSVERSHELGDERVGATTKFELESIRVALEQEGTHPTLTVIGGNQLGLSAVLDRSPLTVGRDPSCDVVLVERGISRKHLRLEIGGNRLAPLLIDMESTNGVYVNGVRIRSRTLSPGDRIQLGPTTVLKFSYEEATDLSIRRQKYEESIRDDLTGAFNLAPVRRGARARAGVREAAPRGVERAPHRHRSLQDGQRSVRSSGG